MSRNEVELGLNPIKRRNPNKVTATTLRTKVNRFLKMSKRVRVTED